MIPRKIKELLTLILLFTGSSCYSQNSSAILHHAGTYLAASDVNEKLNNSSCGYLIIKKNLITLEKASLDIQDKINKNYLVDFNNYISSPDHKERMMKNKYFIDNFISDAKNKKIDFKFSCGLLAGIITTINEPIFINWSKLTNP